MSGGSEGLEIIGASWGRTGTSSFKEAMSILYKNDKNVGKMGACYHMRDNFANKHHAFWITIADCKNEGKPELAAQKLREMFLRLGYKASCDWPSSPYWKEQLQAFPDAKVVLAIREPEKWYQSMMDSVCYMMQGVEHCPLGIRVMANNTTRAFFESVILRDSFNYDLSRDNMLRCYQAHVEEVKRECPPDKLFIFDVKDGWGPLCAFLGKPVPDVPYPNVNDSKSFQMWIRKANTMGYIFGVLGLGIPFLFAKKSQITDPKKKSSNTGSFKHVLIDPLLDYKMLSTFYTASALMTGALVVLHHTFLKGKH